MTEPVFGALVAAAVTVGALHSLAPDHWVPFAAVARAQHWSAGHTSRVTIACGFGHVTVSVLMGLLGLLLGIEVLESVGRRLESAAGLLLILFGLAYAVWGARRAAGRRVHGHTHTHYDHVHDAGRATVWGLFLLFCADPCVAVIPLIFAAAPLGAAKVAGLVIAYEVATIGAMLVLVLPARAGARVLRAAWLDHWGEAAAGATIAATGAIVTVLGV